MTSTFLPLMPPAALTCSSCSLASWPYLRPFSTTMRSVMPIRITPSCARAGLAATPAATATTRTRAKLARLPYCRMSASSVAFVLDQWFGLAEAAASIATGLPSRWRAPPHCCFSATAGAKLLLRRPRRWQSRPTLEAAAGEPVRSQGIERLDLFALEPRHVGLDLVSNPGLQVGQVAVADGKAFKSRLVEHQTCRRINRCNAVLLVDRLAQHEAPTARSEERRVGKEW